MQELIEQYDEFTADSTVCPRHTLGDPYKTADRDYFNPGVHRVQMVRHCRFCGFKQIKIYKTTELWTNR